MMCGEGGDDRGDGCGGGGDGGGGSGGGGDQGSDKLVAVLAVLEAACNL